MGMYWTENGSGPRSSFVIYDRDKSAFSLAGYHSYRWEEILNASKWIHFSGISPAVSKNVALLLQQVVEKISCPYSVDLNFRKKLWQWLKTEEYGVKEVMQQLCSKATLIAGNETDFQNVLGLKGSSTTPDKNYSQIAKQCFDLFPALQYLAISNRVSHSATLNDWSGYLFVRNDAKFLYKSMNYLLDNIQDRVGTGDSFVAGIIYGLNQTDNMSWQDIIDFAVTLGALNHTTKGDASHYCADDVLSAILSRGSGRIQR